jgi:NADPH:quinone reductase-like Zn-dependent oxidoreductase
MRACLYERYGPPEVLELREIPKPTPGDHEVLIKVHATTVTAADWRLRSLSAPKGFGFLMRLALGPSRPRRPILGAELSGEIESVGRAVSRFKVGDQVFAGVLGSYVEYKCVREDGPLALKPTNLGYEEAAAISFGGAYDVVVDNVGNVPFSRVKGSLKKGGRLLLVVGTLSDMLLAPLVSLGSGKRVIPVPARPRAEDLRFLANLAESGSFKPVIDRLYPFERIVEAHRYVDTGRKRGNVVVTM